MSKPIHDGVRHSTAHTQLREAGEAWKAFLAEGGKALMGEYGRLAVETDANALRKLAISLHGIASTLHSALERLHWPKMDYARSLFSDERAFEQAARHLREGHPELAWGLLFSALTHADEWKNNAHFGAMGVDLGAYFRAEADATLRVIMAHHLGAVAKGQS